MEVKNCKNVVYNSANYAIMANDIIKGKQEMTLQEARLIRLLITQIVKEDKDLKTYVIKINELADFLDIDSSNLYKNIRDLCRQLLKRTVSISTGNPKEPWKEFQWIQLAQYDGNGNLTIMLSNQIQPYLLELNAWFTKYKLKNILAMSSFYAIRLYELLELTIGVNKNHGIKNYYDFKIDYLREFLGCKCKFKQIVEFKRKVINICLKEINEKSDLLVDVEYIKTVRTITSIRFFVQEKQVIKHIECAKHVTNNEVIEVITDVLPDTKEQPTVKDEPIEEIKPEEVDIDDLADSLRGFIKEPLKTKELKEILAISNNNIELVLHKYAIYRLHNDIENPAQWLIWAIKTDYEEAVTDTYDLCDELRTIISEPLSTKDLKVLLSASNNNIQLIKDKYQVAKKQGNINNLTAFLISAIKNDFNVPISIAKTPHIFKNRFKNYKEHDDWDFEELARLDEELLIKNLERHEQIEAESD